MPDAIWEGPGYESWHSQNDQPPLSDETSSDSRYFKTAKKRIVIFLRKKKTCWTHKVCTVIYWRSCLIDEEEIMLQQRVWKTPARVGTTHLRLTETAKKEREQFRSYSHKPQTSTYITMVQLTQRCWRLSPNFCVLSCFYCIQQSVQI